MMSKPFKPIVFISLMVLTGALLVGGIIFWLVTTISIFRYANSPVSPPKSKIPALDVKSINTVFPGTLPEGTTKK
jgi:hypothetical protein